MSDKSNEQISNLMDGELEVNASEFLLKRMASDEILSKTWANYHLIKSCLQKEKQEPLLIDVASKVCQQLGKQQHFGGAQQDSVKPQVNRWLKPLMGISIAASVAFMSVFMIQNQQVDSNNAINNTIIAETTNLNPIIKVPITARVATSSQSIVPPPSLSRYPSVTANKYANLYRQGASQTINMPYLIIINQSSNNKQLSPMKLQDISD